MLSFTLIAPLGLVRPMTRTHVGLLGPCFKTGRVDHRPTRRRRAATVQVNGRLIGGHRYGTVGRPARTPGGPRPRRVGSAHPGLRRPSNGSRRPTKGEVRPSRRTNRMPGLAVPDNPAAHALRTESPRSTFEVPRVFLSTVSRTLELSLQSSFQLSLTVLVRYRTSGDI